MSPERQPDPIDSLFEMAGVCVVRAGVDGRIERAGAAFLQLIGCAIGDLHGDDLLSLIYEDDVDALTDALRDIRIGATTHARLEMRFAMTPDHPRWVDLAISVIHDASGHPAALHLIALDIGTRKREEAMLLQRQGLALQGAGLALWEFFPQTGVMKVDMFWAMTLGYALWELDPHISAFRALEHPDDKFERETQVVACLEGHASEFSFERRLRHKDGRWIWVHEQGIVVERGTEGQALRVLGTSQDVSTAKHDRAELLQAKEAADSASRAKSMFLANMSHEIRTPLNAMIGLTRVVLDSELTTRQRDFLQKVQGSSKSLLGILNDILDHAKIEAGRLDLEQIQFSIEEPLNSVANLFGAQVEQKGLELFFEIAPDVPMEAIGDPLRLTQVLNNLVGNAIKFTAQGQVHLKAEVVERSTGSTVLKFSVTDTGIGLTGEQSASLFQAFVQADNSVTRKYGGTGLGLTISRQLVRLMGGDIAVTSAPGEGCCFAFTVRLLPARVALSFDLQSVRGLRALVVDDQETSRQIMASLFNAWGVQAETVASAEEGLACIAQSRIEGRPYDVLLLDWRMPGMDGVEMARRMHLQASPADCPPFAIMVTAYGREQLVSEGGDMNLDVVLTKPVVPSALFDILMRLRHRKGASSTTSAQLKPGAVRFDGARVLLVEDNLLNQEVANEFLVGIGVTVTVANNGAEALALVDAQDFDLVLMDMHMPVMDGVTAARHLSALPSRERMPVVAMTAAVFSEDRARCTAAGMVDFVPKPVDPDELVRVLRRWLPKALGQASDDAPTQANAAQAEPAKRHALPGKYVVRAHEAPDKVPAETLRKGDVETVRETGREAAGDANREASRTTATSLALEGFDEAAALRLLHGNRAKLHRLLRSFANTHREAGARLRALLDSNAAAEARQVVHALHGSAAMLGLGRVASLGREIDMALRNAGSTVAIIPETADFCGSLQRTVDAIDALQDEVPELVSHPALPLDMEAASKIVATVGTFLRDQELIPDELLEKFKRLADAVPLAPHVTAALNHIFDFDHVAALTELERMNRYLEPEKQ